MCGMGKKVGGGFNGEGTYVYPWLIYVDVWQKSTEFCKAIIIQLINKFKIRKNVKTNPLIWKNMYLYIQFDDDLYIHFAIHLKMTQYCKSTILQ